MLEKYFEIFLRLLLNPSIAVKHIWRRFPFGDIELREKFDAFHKPSYAWGILNAAKLAKKLGHTSVSVIEFGVAEGLGFIDMDKIAVEAQKKYGIKIQAYGFEVGSGASESEDFRDMPYYWPKGAFNLDPKWATNIENQLKEAKLVIGNVRDTVKKFKERHDLAPIGFISFDLGFYFNTKDALKVFDTDDKNILPRVFCYFDDVMGDGTLHNEFTGELLAIKEFNDEHAEQKIATIGGFSANRIIKSNWHEGIYVMHRFKHKDYGRYTGT